jgi:hypothetical protein
MSFLPIKKNCDECGLEFIASSAEQTTCTPCLIKPKRKDVDIPEETIQPKGSVMPKEKTCIDCKKPYMPTSNVQKRCFPCIEIHNKEMKILRRKQPNETSAKPKAKESQPAIYSDDATILRMLVAAGLVTEEKIQAVREIVRKLKA